MAVYGVVRNADNVVKGVLRAKQAPGDAQHTYVPLTAQQAQALQQQMDQAVRERGVLTYENGQAVITQRPNLLILDCSDPTVAPGQTVEITARLSGASTGTITVAGRTLPIDANGLTLTVRYN